LSLRYGTAAAGRRRPALSPVLAGRSAATVSRGHRRPSRLRRRALEIGRYEPTRRGDSIR
jgi:hypothetical protein